MAGYIIYSLDWPKFNALVERPSRAQLTILARDLADGREGLDDQFDRGDPVLGWPRAANALTSVVADRLARSDWYSDLSRVGKELWEGTIFAACMNSDDLDVGFRVDSDGIYWDVINLISDRMGERRETPGRSAMSRFGTVPFRYHPPASPRSVDWGPMHSMHPPDEVQRMLEELRSVASAVEASRDASIRQDFAELLQAVEPVAADGRLLFIQVDT